MSDGPEAETDQLGVGEFADEIVSENLKQLTPQQRAQANARAKTLGGSGIGNKGPGFLGNNGGLF